MFNNLELASALNAESARLKKIEKFFLPDVLTVQVVVFPISLRVVRFAHSELISFDRDALLSVAQCYFDRKHNVVSFIGLCSFLNLSHIF